MSSLQELYRETILDHYRNPRLRGSIEGPHLHAEGNNPSCGDEFSLDVIIEDGSITRAATQGQGCSISQASGSMMVEAIVGKTVEDVTDLTHNFKVMMSIEDGDDPIDPDRPGSILGDLEALQGVRKFPVRIKCADLPWTTLEDLMSSYRAEARTS